MIKDFVAIDLETTGLSPYDNKIIELGAVRYRDGKPVDQYNTLINPGVHIPERITEITGIDDDMVSKAPYIVDVPLVVLLLVFVVFALFDVLLLLEFVVLFVDVFLTILNDNAFVAVGNLLSCKIVQGR
ncbi:MAG: hypothetical protein EGR98_00500 [Prevotella sp.]|nr:hypothetical protein [Prevotella sp.]